MGVMQGVRLGVTALNLERRDIVVRDGKEANDRITMVADRLVQPLRRPLLRARQLHEMDVHERLGSVFPPPALERKFPAAAREWAPAESWRSRFRSAGSAGSPRTRTNGEFDRVWSASAQSQLSAPPVWYSITRVSKKFFSFLRSIISAIHGNGLSALSNS